ncbi:MAG: hypothetical protein JSS86_25510 [Cyanobacteria bacterium SZAS LIN-2]|nr:hypothetical protein [Cyanobacteria bacterium SZAS LIN-3]MBS1999715.1 hypothetical protein [Cyanobacteria bacterium SZAS LIN-2]MBS2008310.1 hypothetical protein [Cyanobacteria bacterium SZAS TMP-1]
MGKSFRERRKADFDDFDRAPGAADDVIFVALADVYMAESTVAKLLARDGAQIEQHRQAYECGEDMVRVVLRPRFGGGYNVEDGRHRVIAAKQAGIGFIEAKLIC